MNVVHKIPIPCGKNSSRPKLGDVTYVVDPLDIVIGRLLLLLVDLINLIDQLFKFDGAICEQKIVKIEL